MTIIELAHQVGLNPRWVASTAGGEYHSSCPSCGGSDRFYIQPHKKMRNCSGTYACRRCGIHGDAISFAREFLGYSFKDAAELLHVNLPDSIKTFIPTIQKFPLLKPPSNEWMAQAGFFTNNAHQTLLEHTECLQILKKRGLPLEAIKHYKIGLNCYDQFFSRDSWGLTPQTKEDGNEKRLWVPRGIVIPSIDTSGKIIRLKIRRTSWHEKDPMAKYIAISGSMNGLTLLRKAKHNTMIVVESELDAYALHHIVGEHAYIVGVGSNIKNPDNVVNRLANDVKKLLICHDNDAAGEAMFNKWKKLYGHAKRCPTPSAKDIGEAIQKGIDVFNWLSKILE